MSRDLRRLLHDTAVEPSEPVAPAQLISRARRRRRRRHAATGVGTVAVAAIAAVSVALGPRLVEPQPSEIVDQPPAPVAPGEPDLRPDGDDQADTESGTATVAPTDAGRPLLAFGPEGIRKVDDGGDRLIWGSSTVAALSDLRGGAVLQHAAPDDPTARQGIRWLRAGADAPADPPLVPDDQESVLHAVVEFDGEPTVLFTVRTGQGEDEVETLHAYGLDTGADRALGTTGALESGLGGASMAGDRLVLARCHLHCQLVVIPSGSPPDGGDTVELLPEPMPIQGLDVQRGLAAYVELPPPVGVLDGEREPVLWLHDVDNGERREISLPAPDVALDQVSIEVDLAAEADAVLIGFRRWDDLTWARTLLVDRLDTDARLRWLDTDEHVRFGIPDQASG